MAVLLAGGLLAVGVFTALRGGTSHIAATLSRSFSVMNTSRPLAAAMRRHCQRPKVLRGIMVRTCIVCALAWRPRSHAAR